MTVLAASLHAMLFATSALMGLAAYRKFPTAADDWLAEAARRTRDRSGFLPVIPLALLAALDEHNPLIMLPRFEEYAP